MRRKLPKLINIMSGIYCIENIVDNKKYIGYAIDIYRRWGKHQSDLNRNQHENWYLQNAYNKYGKENFKYYMIQDLFPNIEKLMLMEIYWISYYNTFRNNKDGGYNLTRGGDGTMGYTPSDETKIKNSLSISGEKNYWYGKELSLEHRKNDSNSHIGIKARTNSSSNYVGVSRKKTSEYFAASVTYLGKHHFIGQSKDEIKAALMYNTRSLEIYGNNAKLNNISQIEIDRIWEEDSKEELYYGLNKTQLLEIQQKYVPRYYSQQRLANEYGVFRQTIQAILRMKL